MKSSVFQNTIQWAENLLLLLLLFLQDEMKVFFIIKPTFTPTSDNCGKNICSISMVHSNHTPTTTSGSLSYSGFMFGILQETSHQLIQIQERWRGLFRSSTAIICGGKRHQAFLSGSSSSSFDLTGSDRSCDLVVINNLVAVWKLWSSRQRQQPENLDLRTRVTRTFMFFNQMTRFGWATSTTPVVRKQKTKSRAKARTTNVTAAMMVYFLPDEGNWRSETDERENKTLEKQTGECDE